MSFEKMIINHIASQKKAGVEVAWSNSKLLKSTTDKNGTILSVNNDFIEISGYSLEELIGKQHSLIRHPDMPKIIFKMMWEDLQYKKVAHVIVKNRCKSGDYFWSALEIKSNSDQEKVVTFSGQQSTVALAIITTKITPLYTKLLHLEQENGIASSEGYLNDYLDEQNKFLIDLMDDWVFMDDPENTDDSEII